MTSVPVLLDLLHGCCPHCACASLLEDSSIKNLSVFLLCGGKKKTHPDSVSHVNALLLGSSSSRSSSCGRSVHVLDARSVADSLFRFKLNLDQLDLSDVRVVTSERGRARLQRYQAQLFTAVYTFTYVICNVTSCPTCPVDHAPHTHSPTAGVQQEKDPEEEGDVDEDVTSFVQQLPSLNGQIRILHSTLIPDMFGHGFSCRGGGVSSIATLSSLNLFCSNKRRDPAAIVTENRRRLALQAGFHPLTFTLTKVNHGCAVWVVCQQPEPESYDAMVTARPGLCLAAPGADCLTLLFAEPQTGAMGVAHAGWRGTLLGVAVATVEAMVTALGCRAGDVLVAMGPSVGRCCFALSRKHAVEFTHIHRECVSDTHAHTPHVDLRKANRVLLERVGVRPEHIQDDTDTQRPLVTHCSACNQQHFYSHTRDGTQFGTQAGFIWIKER